MKRIFADTGYWIALLNPRDELYGRALALAQTCSDDQIVTTEMVLTELLNGFSAAGAERSSAFRRLTMPKDRRASLCASRA
jgi:predicted nucleic acid-binding protein